MALNYEMKKLKKDVNILVACPGPVDTEFGDVAEATFRLKSISAKKCAQIIYKAMLNKKMKVFVSFTVKLCYIALKCIPHRIALPIEYRVQKKKTSK
jgi:short-subunit dehydrogenase